MTLGWVAYRSCGCPGAFDEQIGQWTKGATLNRDDAGGKTLHRQFHRQYPQARSLGAELRDGARQQSDKTAARDQANG